MFNRASRPAACILLGLTTLLAPLPALIPPARAATTEQVDNAIQKGIDFLYSQQHPDGLWEEVPHRDPKAGRTRGDSDVKNGQFGGYTAIAVYSLLAAGEKPANEKLTRAIHFLMTTNEMIGIYATGLRAQIWQFLPDHEEADRLKLLQLVSRDKSFFLDPNRFKSGRYAYTSASTQFHNSTSQYGVLGMWGCVETGAGFEVPDNYWRQVEAAWKAAQGPDGGWAYQSKPALPGNAQMEDRPPGWSNSTATMTAAGIATLFITQDYLHSNDGIDPQGNVSNKNIDDGLAWMDKNYKSGWHEGYFLYGLERIGVASGYKFFGTHDWYREGSDDLVKSQKPDGSWKGSFGLVPDTAFDLLFLLRGRAPVVLNKLQYNIADPAAPATLTEGPWNERPRDAANFVKWLANKIEQRDLNWQIVNLNLSQQILHEAPILYLAGKDALSFTPREEGTLKTYIDRGGLVVANADGARTPFTDSLRKLGKKLFPNSTLRDLPADHVIFTGENYRREKWPEKPRVESFTNGSRELLMIIPDADLGKYWQMKSNKADKAVYSELMADIYLYAVDKKNFRTKTDSYLKEPDRKIPAKTVINLARLAYDGNWNPEPGGWDQLAAVLHNTQGIKLVAQKVTLGEGKLKKFKIAHLTGTGPMNLDQKSLDELKAFIKNGGTLILDATGGSPDFAKAASAELAKIDLDLPPPVLPENDPLFTGNGVGIDTTTLKPKYRRFAAPKVGDYHTPHLRAQIIDDRKAVFFSEEDLSTGLVGNEVDGVLGYTPACSTALMTNILLYAAGKIPSAATTTAP